LRAEKRQWPLTPIRQRKHRALAHGVPAPSLMAPHEER